jgi:hypothetical protein
LLGVYAPDQEYGKKGSFHVPDDFFLFVYDNELHLRAAGIPKIRDRSRSIFDSRRISS